jgi:hypothetical protein
MNGGLHSAMMQEKMGIVGRLKGWAFMILLGGRCA